MKSFIYYNPEDTRNMELKQEILTRLQDTVTDPTQAELIVVLGGDGTMIKAIQEMKQYDLPFFGVNCGTLGFLLNDVQGIHDMPTSLDTLEHITEPYIHATITTPTGELVDTYAVNDILISPDIGNRVSYTAVNPQGAEQAIAGGGLVITSAIGATGYRANFDGPLIPIGQKNIGLMGIGTGRFAPTTLQHTPDPYTIHIKPKEAVPIEVRIDGRYQVIPDAKSISFSPSQETFTLLFSPPGFHSKRLKLYSSKLQRSF